MIIIIESHSGPSPSHYSDLYLSPATSHLHAAAGLPLAAGRQSESHLFPVRRRRAAQAYAPTASESVTFQPSSCHRNNRTQRDLIMGNSVSAESERRNACCAFVSRVPDQPFTYMSA